MAFRSAVGTALRLARQGRGFSSVTRANAAQTAPEASAVAAVPSKLNFFRSFAAAAEPALDTSSDAEGAVTQASSWRDLSCRHPLRAAYLIQPYGSRGSCYPC